MAGSSPRSSSSEGRRSEMMARRLPISSSMSSMAWRMAWSLVAHGERASLLGTVKRRQEAYPTPVVEHRHEQSGTGLRNAEPFDRDPHLYRDFCDALRAPVFENPA